METSSKLFWSLAIIILIIQPLSAQDLKLSSNYSGNQTNFSSQIPINFTFNETPSTFVHTVKLSTSQSMLSSHPAANISSQNSVSVASASSNSAGKPSYDKERVNFITDPNTGRKYVADQVIVQFKTQNTGDPSSSNDKIRMAHSRVGAKVKEDFSNYGIPGLQVVQLANGTDVDSAIKEYQANPDVVYAEPDYIISIPSDQSGPLERDINSVHLLSTPNDPYFTELWGLHNTGQTGGTPGADINATSAWEISTGSNSVIVAVVDTGVMYTHSDLSANIWTNPGEIPGNGIDDDHNGYIDDVHGWNFITNTPDPLDDHGHGTHVSGTIGAVGNNGIGVAGVNWHVSIMALKFLNSSGIGSTSDAISAIQYANIKNASVISNSWGGTVNDPALKAAIDASPAIVVCAAGNDATSADVYPEYPAAFNSSNIISVAATNQNDQLSSFSNYGSLSVDLAAPGTNIFSTYYDGTYEFMQGTSMATPHVSGVAALVKSVNPQLTNIQIKNIILNNVDVIPSLTGKVNTSGRLNAFKAVLAAQSISTPPIADFTGSPTIGVAPLTVSFTDKSTNTPTIWNWSFGDGNNTDSQLKNPTHTYFTEGNFTVSLNATNSWGSNISIKVKYVNVTVLTPVANFTVTRTTGKAPVTIRFVDLSTNVPSSWNWTFGDGSSNSTLQNPVHTYLTAGLYNVSLNVTNSAGFNVTTKVGYINVTNAMDKIGVSNGDIWAVDTTGTAIFSMGRDRKIFGGPGNVSVIGDWNGDGYTEIGVYNNGTWLLDYNGDGFYSSGVDKAFSFGGGPGFVPVIGDWNGDGRSKIGVSNGLDWYLDMNGSGIFDPVADHKYWGAIGFTPVIGDWNGDGRDKIGVSNGLTWAIDTTGTTVFNPSRDLKSWGAIGFAPIVGKWR